MEVEAKLKNWISKGGFPLEMRVADAFSDKGFTVSQSVYYRDPDSNKFRESDVVAFTYKYINGLWFTITFVIECKLIAEKPWVILVNDRNTASPEADLPLYMTSNFRNAYDEIKASHKFKSPLLFKNSRKFGYSVVTAFNTNGADRSFEALQSVTKACEHFVSSISKSDRRVESIYYPIIIVDGSLFTARRTREDSIEIESVTKHELLISRSFHEFGNSYVQIFDASDLDGVAKYLKRISLDFFRNYSVILNKALNK